MSGCPARAQGGSGALARFMRTGDSFTVNQVQMCWEGEGELGPHSQTTAGPALLPPATTTREGGVNLAVSWQDPCHTGRVPSHPSLDAWVQLPDTRPSHTAENCSQGNQAKSTAARPPGDGTLEYLFPALPTPRVKGRALSAPHQHLLFSRESHSMPLLSPSPSPDSGYPKWPFPGGGYLAPRVVFSSMENVT